MLAKVSNTGSTDGAELVQVYVSQVSPSINRPTKGLTGFEKVRLKAGEKEKVQLKISKKYATSFYDEERSSWVMEEGKYEVLVGNSSQKVEKAGEVRVSKTAWWTGL